MDQNSANCDNKSEWTMNDRLMKKNTESMSNFLAGDSEFNY